MTRLLVVDDEASEEAEAQVRYYAERAGTHIAIRFIAEIEAVYRGLAEGRLVEAAGGECWPRRGLCSAPWDLAHRDQRMEPVPALEQPRARPEHDQRVVRRWQRPQDWRVLELLPAEEHRAAREWVDLPGPRDAGAILAVMAPVA
jgi:hypothetical protein